MAATCICGLAKPAACSLSALGGGVMCRAKVADFGLSIIMDDQQSHVSNLKVGTPFYLAPEVQHAGRVTTSADVFRCVGVSGACNRVRVSVPQLFS